MLPVGDVVVAAPPSLVADGGALGRGVGHHREIGSPTRLYASAIAAGSPILYCGKGQRRPFRGPISNDPRKEVHDPVIHGG
jgi:hypothetical protein